MADGPRDWSQAWAGLAVFGFLFLSSCTFGAQSSRFSFPQFHAVYVQSNTLVGDFHHPRGVVVAQVVKANIPVRNGVVHLIDKPLIVIDIDIVNFLKVTKRHIVFVTFFFDVEVMVSSDVLLVIIDQTSPSF